MTSDAQNKANRKNAQRSTGPRTAAGKQNASRNSRRHGLRASILKDPSWTVEVDRIAKAFSPKGADREGREKVRTMAGMMMDIMRVEVTRTDLWNMAVHQADEHDGSEREAVACLQILQRLITLDRYEANARSRWRKARTELT